MRTGRNVLSGMFRYAVRKDALSVNPVRESQLTKNIEARGRTGGARDITIEELRFMLAAVRTSRLPCPRKLSRAERNRGTPVKSYTAPTVADYCESTDLADWVTLLAATGLRRSQTLGLLWSDIDLDDCTLRVSGKVVRVKGQGLVRVEKDDDPKNRRGVIALPEFAVEMLRRRKVALAARRLASPPDPNATVLDLVFPSTVWTLRDPQNVGHEWQRVRDALGIPEDVTAHSPRRGRHDPRRSRSVGLSDRRRSDARRPGHDSTPLHGSRPRAPSSCRCTVEPSADSSDAPRAANWLGLRWKIRPTR